MRYAREILERVETAIKAIEEADSFASDAPRLRRTTGRLVGQLHELKRRAAHAFETGVDA